MGANVPFTNEMPLLPGSAVTIPPHPFDTPLGVATTRPSGNTSENANPDAATVLGFVILNVNVVVPFNGIDGAPNALEIDGGPTTSNVSVAGAPVPPWFDDAVTLLSFTPVVRPVTSTLMVHCAVGAISPPVRLTVSLPGSAVMVAVPPQEPVRPLGVATTRPAGSVSVNATPVCVTAVSGFETTIVRLVVPANGTVSAPKVFVAVGRRTTVTVSLAVFPVPAFAEVTASVVFVIWPGEVGVTSTLTVHARFAATVPPASWTSEAPGVAVNEPPHELTGFAGSATTRPAGNESVTPSPVTATEFELEMSSAIRTVPFSGTNSALNVLTIDGGASTSRFAVAGLPLAVSAEVTALVVLAFVPGVVPVTFAEKTHCAAPASVAPVRVRTVLVTTKLPPLQVGVAATGWNVRPDGSVSVKPMLLNERLVFGLRSVNERLLLPLTAMVDGVNCFVSTGGESGLTVRSAVEWLPPGVALTVFAVSWPTVTPVTVTDTVQTSPAFNTAFARFTAPEVMVRVPPHFEDVPVPV